MMYFFMILISIFLILFALKLNSKIKFVVIIWASIIMLLALVFLYKFYKLSN